MSIGMYIAGYTIHVVYWVDWEKYCIGLLIVAKD